MKYISIKKSIKIITNIWIFFTLLILIIVYLRSINGFYGKYDNFLWNWIIQNISPSISILIGSRISIEINESKNDDYYINKSILNIYLVLSIIYLSFIIFMIIYEVYNIKDIFEIINSSNSIVSFLNGIIIGLMAIILSTKKTIQRYEKNPSL